MSIDHLNEMTIQGYLDNQLSGKELDAVNRHLKECDACRQEVQNYREVYQILAAEEPTLLSPDFAQKIAAQVQPSAAPEKPGSDWEFWLAFFGLVVGTGISLAYTGLDFFTRIFSEWILPSFSFDFSILSDLFGQLSQQDVSLLAAAGIILFLVTLGERFIVHRD